jgi:hypothetical protein
LSSIGDSHSPVDRLIGQTFDLADGSKAKVDVDSGVLSILNGDGSVKTDKNTGEPITYNISVGGVHVKGDEALKANSTKINKLFDVIVRNDHGYNAVGSHIASGRASKLTISTADDGKTTIKEEGQYKHSKTNDQGSYVRDFEENKIGTTDETELKRVRPKKTKTKRARHKKTAKKTDTVARESIGNQSGSNNVVAKPIGFIPARSRSNSEDSFRDSSFESRSSLDSLPDDNERFSNFSPENYVDPRESLVQGMLLPPVKEGDDNEDIPVSIPITVSDGSGSGSFVTIPPRIQERTSDVLSPLELDEDLPPVTVSDSSNSGGSTTPPIRDNTPPLTEIQSGSKTTDDIPPKDLTPKVRKRAATADDIGSLDQAPSLEDLKKPLPSFKKAPPPPLEGSRTKNITPFSSPPSEKTQKPVDMLEDQGGNEDPVLDSLFHTPEELEEVQENLEDIPLPTTAGGSVNVPSGNVIPPPPLEMQDKPPNLGSGEKDLEVDLQAILNDLPPIEEPPIHCLGKFIKATQINFLEGGRVPKDTITLLDNFSRALPKSHLETKLFISLLSTALNLYEISIDSPEQQSNFKEIAENTDMQDLAEDFPEFQTILDQLSEKPPSSDVSYSALGRAANYLSSWKPWS